MITASQVKKLIKEAGPYNFKSEFRKLLGVKTKTNENGTFPARFDAKDAQISPDEFSVRELSEGFLGREYVNGLNNPKNDIVQLQEMLNPVTPSNFVDINAFSAVIGGLLEARILENYNLPEFISDRFFETQPTRVNGNKLIGLPNLQLSDDFVAPGQEYPNIGMQERWAIAQPNKKKGLSLSLTKEAVYYDLTGELLSQAASLGRSLGYMKEYWLAAVAQGVNIAAGTAGFIDGLTCNTYIYNGQPTDTPASTFQTSAGTGTSAKYNYVNSLSNPLTNYVSVQNVQAKLNLMREYETNFPIMAPLTDMLVSPNVEYAARTVIHASQVFPVSGASGGLSATGGLGTFAANPIPSLNLMSSAIWNKVLVDSGVSQTNADIYWYAGDFRKAFVYREVWPMQVIQTNPNVPEMQGRDIVAAWFSSWYGTPVVRDPRFIIQSTN